MGCVAHAGGAYLVRNEVSAVTVELRRAALAAQTGRRVHVTGKAVPSENATVPADQVVQETQVKVLGSACNATIGSRKKGCRRARGHGPLRLQG